MLDEKGHEILDDTPCAMPLGFSRPPTLQEQIRRLVRTELSRHAEDLGAETFDEADDFDVGDDYDPSSPWELTFDQEIAQQERKSTDGKSTEERPKEPDNRSDSVSDVPSQSDSEQKEVKKTAV